MFSSRTWRVNLPPSVLAQATMVPTHWPKSDMSAVWAPLAAIPRSPRCLPTVSSTPSPASRLSAKSVGVSLVVAKRMSQIWRQSDGVVHRIEKSWVVIHRIVFHAGIQHRQLQFVPPTTTVTITDAGRLLRRVRCVLSQRDTFVLGGNWGSWIVALLAGQPYFQPTV